jgi:hypothetical protein
MTAQDSTDRTPWHRNPAIMVPATVAILVAIIGGGFTIANTLLGKSPTTTTSTIRPLAPAVITLDPTFMRVGEIRLLRVTGEGFETDRRVTVTFGLGPNQYAQDALVSNGGFTTFLVLPSSLRHAAYQVAATGLQSGRRTTATFNVI